MAQAFRLGLFFASDGCEFGGGFARRAMTLR